jgi:hypothetical protein
LVALNQFYLVVGGWQQDSLVELSSPKKVGIQSIFSLAVIFSHGLVFNNVMFLKLL